MKILKKIIVVMMVVLMLPQITTASEIDKLDSPINPCRNMNDSIAKRLMENFKSNLSFAIKQASDEDNATFKITVLDKRSRPIPKVEIIVTDTQTGKSRENQTNEDGEVQFRGLAPTEHKIKVISAPSGYYFDEDSILLENNVINTKTIFAKSKQDKGKSYKIDYRITDSYGVGLKEIDVKLKSQTQIYIAKTDVYGYAHFNVDDSGKYEVYIDKLSDEFVAHNNFKINDIDIDSEADESIFSTQITEKLKKQFECKLIVNVTKKDAPQERILVSLKDERTDSFKFAYTNKKGKVVFDNLFPGNYNLTVNNSDRLTRNGVGGVHLIEGQVREFNVMLPQGDLSKKSLVLEKKEPQDEKLPESGNKDERMMVFFSLGIIVLAYLFLNKQKQENN